MGVPGDRVTAPATPASETGSVKVLTDLAPVGRPHGSDAVVLAIALVAVSTSGPLIAAAAVPAMAIAFWRNAMAAGVLVPAVLLTCRDELRSLDRRERRLIGLAGLFLALHVATWIPSLSYTSVASATALVATQPVWAALLSGARGVPVGRRVWIGIGVAPLVACWGILFSSPASSQARGVALGQHLGRHATPLP